MREILPLAVAALIGMLLPGCGDRARSRAARPAPAPSGALEAPRPGDGAGDPVRAPASTAGESPRATRPRRTIASSGLGPKNGNGAGLGP